MLNNACVEVTLQLEPVHLTARRIFPVSFLPSTGMLWRVPMGQQQVAAPVERVCYDAMNNLFEVVLKPTTLHLNTVNAAMCLTNDGWLVDEYTLPKASVRRVTDAVAQRRKPNQKPKRRK